MNTLKTIYSLTNTKHPIEGVPAKTFHFVLVLDNLPKQCRRPDWLAELCTITDVHVIEKPHMWCCADKRDVLKLGTTHFTVKGDSDKIN